MAHALRYLMVALATLMPLAVCAQSDSASTPAQAPLLRFTVFSSRPGAEMQFVPRPGAAAQSLVFYPTARSPQYEYRGSMPLRVVDAKTGAVVAEVTVPSSISEALLIFLPTEPAPTAREGLRYRVLVLDEARRAPGSLTIINLSGLALSGSLGEEPITLVEGLNPDQRVPGNVGLTLRTKVGARTFQSYAGEISLRKGSRGLLLLLPPFYKGSHEVQARLLSDVASAGLRSHAR